MPSNYKDLIIGVLSLIAVIILVFIAYEEINKIDQSTNQLVSTNNENDINASKNNLNLSSTTNDNNINKVISTYDLCVEKSKPFKDLYYISNNECRILSEYNDFDQLKVTEQERERLLTEFTTKYNNATRDLFDLEVGKIAALNINNIYKLDDKFYISANGSHRFWFYPDCEVEGTIKTYYDFWGATVTEICINGESSLQNYFPERQIAISEEAKIYLRSDNFDKINLYYLNASSDLKFLNNYFSKSLFKRLYNVEIIDGKVTKIVEAYQQ